jgi:hypothetical protein
LPQARPINPIRATNPNPYRELEQALDPAKTTDEKRFFFNNFMRGVGLSLNRTGTGFLNLVGSIPGLGGVKEFAEENRAAAEEVFDPEGAAGTAGKIFGAIAGEGATALGGGGLVTKGLGKLLPRAAAALQRTQATGSLGKRALATAAPFVPVDLAIGAARAEEGKRVQGALEDAAIGIIAAPVFSLGADGAKRFLWHVKGKLQRGTAAVPTPPPDELLRRAKLSDADAIREITETISPERAADAINLAKIGLDTESTGVFVKQVQRVLSTNPKLKAPVPHAKVLADAQKKGMANVLAAKDLTEAEWIAARELINDNANEIVTLSKRVTGLTPPEELSQIQAQIDRLNELNHIYLTKTITFTSQSARRLNLHKLIVGAKNGLDKSVWLTRAMAVGGDDMWAQHGVAITRRISELIDAKNVKGLLELIESLSTSTISQKIVTLWKAGLLTMPKSHFINIFSNTTEMGLEMVKDEPGAFFDMIISKAAGTERTTARSLRRFGIPQAIASVRGGKRGIKRGLRTLKEGSTDIGKFEHKQTQFTKFGDPTAREALAAGKPIRAIRSGFNVFADAYTEIVFRSLSAEDQFFKGIAFSRALEKQSRVIAHNRGFRGRKLDDEAARILRNELNDDLVVTSIVDAEIVTAFERAKQEALEATFQDQTVFGRILGKGAKEAGVAGEFIVPFRRTPSAIAKRVLEFSPIGQLEGGIKAFRSIHLAKRGQMAAALAMQKNAADILGRSTTGFGLIGLGYWLASKGLATGQAPKLGTSQRAAFDASGMQPNSMFTGEAWQNTGRLAPGGNLVSIGASLYEILSEPGKSSGEMFLSGFVQSAGLSFKTVSDQPFVTGLRSVEKLFTDAPRALDQFANDMIGSIMPALVGGIARSIDPKVRQTRSDEVGIEGLKQSLKSKFISRVPGFSTTLPERHNVFDEVIERSPGFIANIFNPLSPRKATDNPAVRELVRVGAGVPRITQGDDESPEAFAARRHGLGLAALLGAEALFARPEYQRAEDWARIALQEEGKPVTRRALRIRTRVIQRNMFDAVIGSARQAVGQAFR